VFYLVFSSYFDVFFAAAVAQQLSQFCFPTLTFSVLSAVLAWFFVLSFIATVCLAFLLKREKKRAQFFHTKYVSSPDSDCSQNSIKF
jgi:hypothetical protein